MELVNGKMFLLFFPVGDIMIISIVKRGDKCIHLTLSFKLHAKYLCEYIFEIKLYPVLIAYVLSFLEELKCFISCFIAVFFILLQVSPAVIGA